MHIKAKLYPYPVLASFNNDYLDSSFDIKVAKEYDLINNEFTGELYTESDKNNGYEYTPVYQSSIPTGQDSVVEKPLSLPKGKLMYMDVK